MSKKQKLNIELLKKVRARIALIPRSYDQEVYIRHTKTSPCGTAACIAGETVIVSAPSLKLGIQTLEDIDERADVSGYAAKLLGLNDEESRVLFCGSPAGCSDPKCDCASWPQPFAAQYNKARNANTRAAAAVAYLDHIIETGKVLG